jgi:hypothetical protein
MRDNPFPPPYQMSTRNSKNLPILQKRLLRKMERRAPEQVPYYLRMTGACGYGVQMFL